MIVADALSVDDSTCGQNMTAVGHNEYLYHNELYFHYYDESEVRQLCEGCAGLRVVELKATRWSELPHEGFRADEHEHEGWAVVLTVEQ
jgi:hypothetical protein